MRISNSSSITIVQHITALQHALQHLPVKNPPKTVMRSKHKFKKALREFQQIHIRSNHNLYSGYTLTLALLGNLIPFMEDIISGLVISQFIKGLQEYSPVSRTQLEIASCCASILFLLRSFNTYYLLRPLRANNTDEEKGQLMDERAIALHDPVVSNFTYYSAQFSMSLNGLSQIATMFAGLYATLKTRWPAKGADELTIGYYLFFSLFTLVAIADGFVVGFGDGSQSFRSAGLMARAKFIARPWVKRFLSISQIIPPVMVFAYFGGMFASVMNFLEFISPIDVNNDLTAIHAWTSLAVAGIVSPCLWSDYLCVRTQLNFLYWNFGQTPPSNNYHRWSAPIGKTLKLLHDNTVLRIFKNNSKSAFDQYDQSLYWSKVVPRTLMLMTLFYNIMKIYLATDQPLYLRDNFWLAALPLLSLLLAFFSAKADFTKLNYCPTLQSLKYKQNLLGSHSYRMSANEMRRTLDASTHLIAGANPATQHFQDLHDHYEKLIRGNPVQAVATASNTVALATLSQ